MINNILKNKILVLVLILSAVLRLWKLNVVPPHLTPDEAALGYNAYSILETARDEHGKFLPIVFQSFGDYKPGLYVYATVPFVAILGLNEWSVRLPSAIAGIAIVFLVGLIIDELNFNKSLKIENRKLKIAASFAAAVSPWLVTFSRGAWEVNLSLALTLLGIYFFLRSLHTSYYILHSAVAFALTLLAYQGAKLSSSIVLAILIVTYWKEFFKLPRKYLVSSALLGFLISLPIVFSIFTGQGGRLEVFSIFSYPRSKEYIQSMLNEGGEKIGGISYYLYHGESYNFLRGVMGRWFNHFSGRFLFFEGDWSNPRHSSPYQGEMLLSDILFLLLGLVFILKSKIANQKSRLFVLLWLVLAPLPAILSRDQVHAVRALNMAIPLVILSGMGIYYALQKFHKFKFVFLAFVFLAFVYYLDSYFMHLTVHDSKYWEYGYKQIVETVSPIKDNYKKVVVQQSFAQPYIYFLFYTKYDPKLWQSQNNYIESEYKGDVGYVTHVDNIYFDAIDWSRNRGDHGVLFVSDTLRIPPLDSNDEKEFELVKEIKYLDGLNTAFRILAVK